MPTVNITQLALLAVFASVALLAGGIAALVLSRPDGSGRRRLRQAVSASTTGAVTPEPLPLTSDGSLEGMWEDIARILPRSKKEMTRLHVRMQRAGIEPPGAPVIYSIAEFVLP